MAFEIVELAGTCTAGGALTLESSAQTGYIEKIVMDYDDGATGSDLVITTEEGTAISPIMTIANVGVADAAWYPRTLCNKIADGSAFTDVAQRIFTSGTIKIVVAQGGASKNFRFLVTLIK